MSRVKSCTVSRKKHKKILKKTKGFIGRRKSCYKIAKQAYIRSLMYSYRDRKKKKTLLKKKYLTKFNYFLKENNIKYSVFIKKKKEQNILLDIKIMYLISKLCKKDDNLSRLFFNFFK